ncbi:PREDICTED: protein-tyrosine sulfotransferase isoform X1 [Camelina sativa]|uniref:Protein-tyrosine sulfotransferase isoform X1 n=1 Tax=Camelina sativa TaxID=90675 RepID=A0ABM0XMV8_CAMSA|nr:PREDICTED: protein-tyrosine sulfotransferase isoform X1 [Camelina sativa]XP_019098893.1 PREDICTED: protein-tyrosine sulfotransferase isoform X1 [Camelina sativa]
MSTRSRFPHNIRVWNRGTMKLNPIWKLMALGSLLLASVIGSFAELDFGHCERVVKNWADSSSSREEHVNNDKRSLKDLLFFLHVPRTGGRTYFHCFLRKLYDSSEECPRSYDKLHFNPRKEKCKLLATHDDYSVMAKLPRERTSVMTIVRDPIARVLSTYEFSVEVAARFLVHPNLTSASRMSSRIRKSNVISTLDIWPWTYLVPWMREDLFARRDARKVKGVVIIEDDNPYDMEEMLMPLRKYLDAPTAHDIIHNGATFQITGLTNNSYLSEAHEVRHCVQKYKSLGEHVLQVAKRRLDSMLYVGLTEEHRESASLFANVVGSQVLSQGVPSDATAKTKTFRSEASVTISEPGSDKSNIQNGTSEVASNITTEAKSGNMTVKTLMEVYEGCITHLRKSQGTRRANSLKRISPANFTKGTRTRVPREVIQQIKSLNNLDVELFKYAKEIFAKEHELVSKKLISTSKRSIGDLPSEIRNVFGEMGDEKLWKLLPMALILLLLFLLFLFVNARRRRTSKVKI